MAKERVRIRVLEGGHHIELEDIERRFFSGIKNLFDIYLPIADEVFIFDNSIGKHELIAEKINTTELEIINKIKFENLKKSYHDIGRKNRTKE